MGRILAVLPVLPLLLAACAAPEVPPLTEGPLYEGKPLPHYLREIRDLSPERKAAAATALRYFGEAAVPAISSLVDALRHDACRDHAARALEAIGPACLPAVIEAMASSPDTGIREHAAFVLAGFVERGARSPEILEALGRGLDDAEGAAGWSAFATRFLGTDAAPWIPRLETLASGTGFAAREARESLERLREGK